MSENDWWKIFTVVCLVSLIGLMEYQGLINLFDDDFKSKQETKEGTKVINNKLTKLKTLEWGLRYLDVFEESRLHDVC